ncbi:hypothetical protein [Curtobacterium sp. MCBA15_001]|uniref:hypothetical protein n=1 Tax=Curtobacterium sp. MCBA15_001 TaxID=1898731 RepID=UPI0011144051|nr:hypothetical protein [Curtobacterium sp. MCBA15_001]
MEVQEASDTVVSPFRCAAVTADTHSLFVVVFEETTDDAAVVAADAGATAMAPNINAIAAVPTVPAMSLLVVFIEMNPLSVRLPRDAACDEVRSSSGRPHQTAG